MTDMLKELAEIAARYGEKTVDDLRKVANALLTKQFLFAGDRGSGHVYTVLTSPVLRPYFSALFDALGYSPALQRRGTMGGLLPDAALDLFPTMRDEPTRVLLVLALVWQEEINRGGAESRAVVVTSLNKVFERYRDLVARTRKETLTTAPFEKTLREFERRGLVRVGDLDPEENDKQIDIRPMVHLLVDGNALERLERFCVDAESSGARARRRTEDAA